jgi:uncharacterized protein (DUF4415 family)
MRKKSDAGQQAWNDPDDVPELTDAYFENAAIYQGEVLIRPGRRGRPRVAAPKKLTSLRIDPSVLTAFRAMGPGWQTRMNAVLKDYLMRRRKKTAARQPSLTRQRARRLKA